jgi:hypothetical protein
MIVKAKIDPIRMKHSTMKRRASCPPPMTAILVKGALMLHMKHAIIA